jgi:hypothetical protein
MDFDSGLKLARTAVLHEGFCLGTASGFALVSSDGPVVSAVPCAHQQNQNNPQNDQHGANITAYSAKSWPSSSRHSLCRGLVMFAPRFSPLHISLLKYSLILAYNLLDLSRSSPGGVPEATDGIDWLHHTVHPKQELSSKTVDKSTSRKNTPCRMSNNPRQFGPFL